MRSPDGPEAQALPEKRFADFAASPSIPRIQTCRFRACPRSLPANRSVRSGTIYYWWRRPGRFKRDTAQGQGDRFCRHSSPLFFQDCASVRPPGRFDRISIGAHPMFQFRGQVDFQAMFNDPPMPIADANSRTKGPGMIDKILAEIEGLIGRLFIGCALAVAGGVIGYFAAPIIKKLGLM